MLYVFQGTDKLRYHSQSHVYHLSRAFGFRRGGSRFTRHRAKEALKLRSRQARSCPHMRLAEVRQPTTTLLHSQVAFDRITRPSASQPAVRTLYPIPLAIPNNRVFPANKSQPSSQTTVSSDNLEFLQRPNGDSDLPVAAPIEPLGGGDPAPDTEPVKAPEHHEESHATKSAPSASETKPAKESQ